MLLPILGNIDILNAGHGPVHLHLCDQKTRHSIHRSHIKTVYGYVRKNITSLTRKGNLDSMSYNNTFATYLGASAKVYAHFAHVS